MTSGRPPSQGKRRGSKRIESQGGGRPPRCDCVQDRLVHRHVGRSVDRGRAEQSPGSLGVTVWGRYHGFTALVICVDNYFVSDFSNTFCKNVRLISLDKLVTGLGAFVVWGELTPR